MKDILQVLHFTGLEEIEKHLKPRQTYLGFKRCSYDIVAMISCVLSYVEYANVNKMCLSLLLVVLGHWVMTEVTYESI